MKFFNKYNRKDNFRWIGLYFLKTSFGFGFSFGKPLWHIPYIEFILNDKNVANKTRKYLSVSLGWFLFCFRIQILHGYTSTPDDTYVSVPPKHNKYVKTKYVYRGKGKPLPYTRDI